MSADEVEADLHKVSEEEPVPVEDQQQRPEEDQELSSGLALTIPGARRVARSRRPFLIVFAGPPSSGKTTLLAGIFEAFLNGPVANHLFAGTDTPIGFEERCHELRVASGNAKVRMPHSPLGDQRQLLHLDVRRDDLVEPIHSLLFADMSGEVFTSIQNTGDAAESGPILSRADRVIVVLDGQRFADLETRARAREEVRMIARASSEHRIFESAVGIDVIVTKWDEVTDDRVSAEDREWVLERQQELGRDFGQIATTTSDLQLAMQTGGEVNAGHNLERLFERCLADSPTSTYLKETLPPDAIHESHRFSWQGGH